MDPEEQCHLFTSRQDKIWWHEDFCDLDEKTKKTFHEWCVVDAVGVDNGTVELELEEYPSRPMGGPHRVYLTATLAKTEFMSSLKYFLTSDTGSECCYTGYYGFYLREKPAPKPAKR